MRFIKENKQYVGGWKSNTAYGKGIIKDSWRERLKGLFRDGRIVMKLSGEKRYKDGSIYKGGFWMGKRTNQGTLKYVKGCNYTGEWKNDKLSG